MIKINNTLTLNQYNSNSNKMSNIISKNLIKIPFKSLTIQEMLTNFNLNTNIQNKLIAQELLNLNLPLKKSLFRDINNLLDEVNNSSPNNLETKIKVALLLKRLNLPLSPKFFQLFKESINLKDNLTENLNKLLSKLDSTKITNINPKTNIDNLIQRLNLKPTSLNKKILQEMIKFNLPTDKNIFMQIKNSIKNSNLEKDIIKKFGLLQKLELPLNKQNASLFSQINFSSQDNLTQGIIKLIKEVMLNNSNQETSTLILPKLKNIINENPKLLIQLKEQLSKTNLEFLLNKLDIPSTEENNLLKKGIKQEITNNIISPHNLTIENIKQTLNNFNIDITKENKLLKLLFHLKENNFSAEIPHQKLINQLVNLKTINYDSEVLTLFLPLFINNDLNLGQIKVETKEKNNSNQANKELDLSFAINTKKLGTVEVKLKIKNNKLNGLFITNNPKTLKLITKHLNTFKKRLKDINYQINHLNCKLDDKEILTDQKQELKLTSIDFKI